MSLLSDEKNKMLEFVYQNSRVEEREVVLTNHSLWGIASKENPSWRNQYYRNQAQMSFLNELSHVKNLEDKFVVLKGMALLLLGVYEDWGERLVGDIDLLVEDLDLFHDALTQHFGAIEIDCNRWSGNNFKRNYSISHWGIEIVIELHTRLFNHIPEVEYRVVKLESGLLVLEKEELLMHLVGHLAYQHTFLKLHWLLDIQLLLIFLGDSLDKIKFYTLLNSHRLINSWKMTESYIDLVFKGKMELNSIIYSPTFLLFPEKSRFQYYLIKHLVKDNWMDNIRYDWFWLTQKGWLK